MGFKYSKINPEKSSSPNSALPSPCATGIGIKDPAISLKKIDGDSLIKTWLNLASNFSELFRLNLGQAAVPGIKLDNKDKVWHPLQMPREKTSSLEKNC